MKVLRISARDTYSIRNQILRPGKPVESCHFDNDESDQTFHLGAFVEGRLVSVASFYFQKNPQLEGENHYQLRGMATLEGHQGQGLSSELLKVAFPIISQNFCNQVWCNARVSAKGFYKKVGFQEIGEVFEIPEIGPHILMHKDIN